MNPEDIAAAIMARIAALPLDEQPAAIHNLISESMNKMDVEKIREMRDEIAAQFPEEVPIVSSTLDLINGHLALREMGLIDSE